MKVCTTCGGEYGDDQKFCPNDGSPLRSSVQGDLIDSIVADRYHITKKLGEGGMGAVYLGEHVKMGRMSAIKVMSQGMASDPDAIARFNREAANAARINHPNVCAIYDFGETPDGTIYLAMEFIEGAELTAIIQAEGALPPDRATDILRQTADALQAAHDLGIVHRDLKPDNIMISKGRGGRDVVKVVDFGIAKAMGGEEGQNVTKTGLVVGTPEYMSPEQLSGDVLDGRSDTYSLALVFYRMLTGVLPFQADSAQETMIKRLTDDPIPLNQARPGTTFPAGLQQAMDKALARMPGERYESASQFADDVAAAISEMPDDAAAPQQEEAATQTMDAADVTAAQVAATRVAGSPAPAEPTVPPTPAVEPLDAPTPTTPQPAPPPPMVTGKKKSPVVAVAAAAIVVAGVGIGTVMATRGGGDGGNGLDSTQVGGPVGVIDDTARDLAVGEPSVAETTQTGGTGNGDRQPVDTGRQTIAPPETTVVTPPDDVIAPPQIQVDPAGADDWLFERVADIGINTGNAAGIRDTAMAYYNHPNISQTDRAFAANAVGQAYFVLGDNDEALRWGREAVSLDGASRVYQGFVTQVLQALGRQ